MHHGITNIQSEGDSNNPIFSNYDGPSNAPTPLLAFALQCGELALPCYRVIFEVFTGTALLVMVPERGDAVPGCLGLCHSRGTSVDTSLVFEVVLIGLDRTVVLLSIE
jgi:hypothetical protein